MEAGFLSLGGTEGLPPEWWQLSMSAISSDELWLAEFFWIEDASRIVGEPARTGCVQPITQAKAAIHKETAVAIAALRVRLVKRISNYIIRFLARKDPPTQRRFSELKRGHPPWSSVVSFQFSVREEGFLWSCFRDALVVWSSVVSL